MSALIVLGLLTGLDNFRVGIGLGTLNLTAHRRWQLAIGFGLFEAIMPLVGVLIGGVLANSFEVYVEWLGPILLATCGILVLWGGMYRFETRQRISNTSLLFALPIALSFDNLMAGSAIAAMNVPLLVALPILGLLSATLSLLGLYCGDTIIRHIPIRRGFAAGGALILISLIGVLIGG